MIRLRRTSFVREPGSFAAMMNAFDGRDSRGERERGREGVTSGAAFSTLRGWRMSRETKDGILSQRGADHARAAKRGSRFPRRLREPWLV